MTTDSSRSLRRRRRASGLALAAAGLALALPGLASADSIVFVKDANVWIAKPDGSGQYQVTRDGTAAQPYSSPSQADDGTIAASHGTEIVRMRQNGSVLNRMDPPPLINSVSQPVDGAPSTVAISPDGSKIVYSLVDVSCPIAGPACAARPATAVTPADRMAPTGNLFTFGSSWVTENRILTFAGYRHQVNTYDVGAESDVHWFDDEEIPKGVPSTDQSDGEVNRQGTYVATIRGSGTDRTVMWLKVRGNVQTGSRADGTLLLPDPTNGCVTTATSEIAGPTWSPSGTALAWYEEGAIHVWSDVSRCAGASSQPVIPGGSEPDWGPADVNPGPRQAEPSPPVVTPPPVTTPPVVTPPVVTPPPPSATGSIRLTGAVRLKTALSSGFRVRVRGGRVGRRSFTARLSGRTVASGTAKLAQDGTATVRLRFTAQARRSLAKRARITLRISGAGVSGSVTIKR